MTMTKAEREAMVALADACEKATGPDRSIDCWIENRLGLARFVADRPAPHGEGWLEKRVEPKPYTASLDAAMTLVPEGASASVNAPGSYEGNPWARCHLPGQGPIPPSYNGHGGTPALALTAAALRARANQGTPA